MILSGHDGAALQSKAAALGFHTVALGIQLAAAIVVLQGQVAAAHDKGVPVGLAIVGAGQGIAVQIHRNGVLHLDTDRNLIISQQNNISANRNGLFQGFIFGSADLGNIVAGSQLIDLAVFHPGILDFGFVGIGIGSDRFGKGLIGIITHAHDTFDGAAGDGGGRIGEISGSIHCVVRAADAAAFHKDRAAVVDDGSTDGLILSGHDGAALQSKAAALGFHTVALGIQLAAAIVVLQGQVAAAHDKGVPVGLAIVGAGQGIAVQIHRNGVLHLDADSDLIVGQQDNVAANRNSFFQRCVIGVADHGHSGAIKAAVIAHVAAFQIAAALGGGIIAGTGAGMGAIIMGNIIGILMGMNGCLLFFRLFLFHDFPPLGVHRQVGSDHRAGMESLTVGSVPAGKGVPGTGGAACRTGSTSLLHRNGGISTPAAVIVLEGNSISFGFDLHLRLGLGGSHLFCIAIQNYSQLGTDGAALGHQLGADTVDQARAAGPLHGLYRPRADTGAVAIGCQAGILALADIVTLQLGITVQHGYQLLAGDIAVGIGTVGHAGDHGPVLTGQIPGIAAGGVHALQTGQCGPHHGPADAAVGIKCVVANTVHQFVLINIRHFFGEPVVGLHVGYDALCRKCRRRKGQDHTQGQQNGKNAFFHETLLVS